MSPAMLRIASGLALVAIILVASSTVEARHHHHHHQRAAAAAAAAEDSDDDHSERQLVKLDHGNHLDRHNRGTFDDILQCVSKLVQNLFKGEAKFPEECCKIPIFGALCKNKERSIRLGYIQPANKCARREPSSSNDDDDEEL